MGATRTARRMAKRAAGSVALAASVVWCLAQLEPTSLNRALAYTCCPSSDSSATSTAWSASCRRTRHQQSSRQQPRDREGPPEQFCQPAMRMCTVPVSS
jgi:hypothetical protein